MKYLPLCHFERSEKSFLQIKEMFGLTPQRDKKGTNISKQKSNMPTQEPKQKGKGNEAKNRETKGKQTQLFKIALWLYGF